LDALKPGFEWCCGEELLLTAVILVPVYLTLMLPQKQLPRGILLVWLVASDFVDQKTEVNWSMWIDCWNLEKVCVVSFDRNSVVLWFLSIYVSR
jgi:hypothetical protein